MVKFRISLSDFSIDVCAMFDSTAAFCAEYFTDKSPDISVVTTPEDIALEREYSRREMELEGLPPSDFSDEYLETLALYRKIVESLCSRGVILFHGSALMMDGQAYLFTAPSGTGKSTHSSIWRRVFGDRVSMINDDKPLIRMEDDKITVYGTPWNGKHRLGARVCAPLSAVASLYRSKNNEIKELSRADAMTVAIAQSYRPHTREGLASVLQSVDRLVRSVRFFALGCNMDDEAAIIACRAMKGDL